MGDMIRVCGLWARACVACLCVTLLCPAGCTESPDAGEPGADANVESGTGEDPATSTPDSGQDAGDSDQSGSGGGDPSPQPQAGSGGGESPDGGVSPDAATGGREGEIPGMDSGPGDVDSGPGDVDAGPDPEPECSEEGALRCVVGATAAREICSEGSWQATEDCASEEICDAANTDAPGTCVPVTALCAGSEGAFICMNGVMHECDADATSVSQQSCQSQAHCQVGLPSEQCATCIPGLDHQCNDQSLEQCEEDGMGYAEKEVCTAEAPCNADAGACTALACLEGSFLCSSGELLACNADQTAFEVIDQCDPGMCDAENGQCDVCVAGLDEKCTDEGDPAVCDAEGQGWDVGSCDASTPICLGQGNCVQCTGDGQCSTDEDCMQPACTPSHVCTAVADPAAEDDPCDKGNITGVCNDAGDCVECNDHDDCTTESKPYCSSINTCVACTEKDGQCGDEFCKVDVADPSQNKCVECVVSTDCGDPSLECVEGSCGDICGNGRIDPGEQCDDGTPTGAGSDDYDGCGLDCQINTVGGCPPEPTGLPSYYVTWNEETSEGLWMWAVAHPDNATVATCAWPCGEIVTIYEQYPEYPDGDCGATPSAWQIPGTDPALAAECYNGGCVIRCGEGGTCPPGYTCEDPWVIHVAEWISQYHANGGEPPEIPPLMQAENVCMATSIYPWWWLDG